MFQTPKKKQHQNTNQKKVTPPPPPTTPPIYPSFVYCQLKFILFWTAVQKHLTCVSKSPRYRSARMQWKSSWSFMPSRMYKHRSEYRSSPSLRSGGGGITYRERWRVLRFPKIPQVMDQILGNSKDKINKQKSQPNRHEVDSLFFFARWWWGVPFWKIWQPDSKSGWTKMWWIMKYCY